MSQIENIDKVKSGEITPLEFLQSSNDYENYRDWCNSHNVSMDEDSAEFYFDQTFNTDYDETDVLIEIYP